MTDESGVEQFELNEAEKKLVLAALQRMSIRGRYRRVEGAKLVDFQKLMAKFSNKDVLRVGQKYINMKRKNQRRAPPKNGSELKLS